MVMVVAHVELGSRRVARSQPSLLHHVRRASNLCTGGLPSILYGQKMGSSTDPPFEWRRRAVLELLLAVVQLTVTAKTMELRVDLPSGSPIGSRTRSSAPLWMSSSPSSTHPSADEPVLDSPLC